MSLTHFPQARLLRTSLTPCPSFDRTFLSLSLSTTQADTLRETMWKQLPHIAVALGKKAFECHIDIFLKPLVLTISRPGAHQLAVHAAIDCIKELGEFMGLNFLRGRLLEVCGEEVHLNVKEESLKNFPSCWKIAQSPTALTTIHNK